jgi:hypothetical protein
MTADLETSTLKVCTLILKDAKKMAPVQSGALRASGRLESQKKGGTMLTRTYTVSVAFGGSGTGVDYAPFVEYGRQSVRPMAPRPFLRPAVLKNGHAVRGITVGRFRRSWDRAVKRGGS